MNQGEHAEMLLLKLARRIKQHAFDGFAIGGFPLEGLHARQIAFGKERIQMSDLPGGIEMRSADSEKQFGRLIHRGISKQQCAVMR